jgi:hypothetical protein
MNEGAGGVDMRSTFLEVGDDQEAVMIILLFRARRSERPPGFFFA